MLKSPKHWLTALFLFLVVVSYFHIRMRMQTVLLGYNISDLQDEVSTLREDRNALQTQLSRLTLESKLRKAAKLGTGEGKPK
jgi:cell division protein FtsL